MRHRLDQPLVEVQPADSQPSLFSPIRRKGRGGLRLTDQSELDPVQRRGTGGDERCFQSECSQRRSPARHQAFAAGFIARKGRLVDQDDPPATAGHEQGGGRARRPSADDGQVGVELSHRLTIGTRLDPVAFVKLSIVCRSIKVLRRQNSAPNEQEIHEAALQFVRKISGYRTPSKKNADSFEAAVEDVTRSSRRLLESLALNAPAASPHQDGAAGDQREQKQRRYIEQGSGRPRARIRAGSTRA